MNLKTSFILAIAIFLGFVIGYLCTLGNMAFLVVGVLTFPLIYLDFKNRKLLVILTILSSHFSGLIFIYDAQYMIHAEDRYLVVGFYIVAVLYFSFFMIFGLKSVDFLVSKLGTAYGFSSGVVFFLLLCVLRNAIPGDLLGYYHPLMMQSLLVQISPIHSKWVLDAAIVILLSLAYLALSDKYTWKHRLCIILVSFALLSPVTEYNINSETDKIYTHDIERSITQPETLRQIIRDTDHVFQVANTLPENSILLLPEGFFSIFEKDIADIYQFELQEIEKRGIKIYGGSTRESSNVMVMLGSEEVQYKKRVLAPIGERPLEIFGHEITFRREENRGVPELEVDSATLPPLEHNGKKYTSAICFDVFFPGPLLEEAQSTDAILIGANIAWFRRSHYVENYYRNVASYLSWLSEKPAYIALTTDFVES